ncbi:MAG: uroporphyrinogen decarboxylase [Bacteroidia bacterium]
MTFSPTEVIGYLASFTVLISFLMKNISNLRIINTIGCILFIAYGILLGFSIPIILTNAAITGINIYYLLKMYKKA